MQDYKAPKLDGSVPEAARRNKEKLVVPCDSSASSTDLHQKLKEQNDALWKLKDELKKHVSTAELRDMLEVNEQDPSGPEWDLLERW
jgi:poly [ADP-ribose] polymerase